MAHAVTINDDRLMDREEMWVAGRYQLARLRARGALNVVYVGQDAILQRPVAMKVTDLEHAAQFGAALSASAALSHPAFIAVYDLLEHDGALFLAQEHIDGRPLTDYLAEGAPTRRAVALASQLARAIAYAHHREVAHGDLTLDAILVDRSALAHINNLQAPTDWAYFERWVTRASDCGLSEASVTDTLSLLRADERRRDVWAVGVALWALLAPSTEAVSAGATAAFREEVPEAVRMVVARALDPGHPEALTRADDLAVALEDLDTHLAGETGEDVRSIPLAIRAFRESVRLQRLEAAHAHRLGSPSASAPTYPDVDEVDDNATRLADGEQFVALPQHLRLTARPAGGRALLSRDAANAAWPDAERKSAPVPNQPRRVIAMGLWIALGVALFVALFLVGYLAFPYIKLF